MSTALERSRDESLALAAAAPLGWSGAGIVGVSVKKVSPAGCRIRKGNPCVQAWVRSKEDNRQQGETQKAAASKPGREQKRNATLVFHKTPFSITLKGMFLRLFTVAFYRCG
jgi:hypothetical protein